MLFIVAMLLSASGWTTTRIPWNGPSYFITTRGAKVADVLKGIGSNYSIPMIVSPEVDDYFMGTIRDARPDEIIERFVQLFNLATYYDGQALYIYKTHEVKSQIITPHYLTTDRLINYLNQNNTTAQQFCALREVTNFNALEVFGVPKCIERVSELAKNLDEKILDQAQNQETVRVFPLRFASADDNVYTYRNQQVRVPGMVTVLREMIRGRSVSGEGVPTVGTQNIGGLTAAIPSFSADPQRNAIVVRDRQVNMSMYVDLIKQLDHASTPVEISVVIIDVNATDMNALGVDWSGNLRVGAGAVNFNTANFEGGFSTVLNDTSNFLVQLSALERHSKAKILSRPSVMTLDNVQAVLDRSITFFTKLEGERVASLESVSTGSLLRVTPRLVNNAGHQQIILILNIQDGRQVKAIGSEEVLPQIQNAEISTQATLRPGQSLLLGGFIQDEQKQNERKIPLLGDIPILGSLFRAKDHRTDKVVRLFLIKAEPRPILTANQ